MENTYSCRSQSEDPAQIKREPSTATPAQHIFEFGHDQRIIDIDRGGCSLAMTEAVMREWRRESAYIIFHSGAFDILTPNHILGLTHDRLLAAQCILGIDDLRDPKNLEKAHALAASGDIRLMVSLDTNRAVAEGKSGRPEKGGSVRPILDWRTRAMMLAAQSMASPIPSHRVDLVDFITHHGPDCCPGRPDGVCTNNNNIWMASVLQPNLLIVNAASSGTREDIEISQRSGGLRSTRIEYIDEGADQYLDPLIAGPVKTSGIVYRARL